MIRRNQKILNRVNVLLNMLLVVLAYALASRVRFAFPDGRVFDIFSRYL